MIALAYYLLKVIICSGVLFLYYHLALRNKVFHQWNRAYLLFAVALSLLLPLVQLTLFTASEEGSAIQLIRVVESADRYMETISTSGDSSFGFEELALLLYTGISVAMLVSLIYAVFKIIMLIKTHTIRWVENIRFVMTNTPGTPFSFLNYIFWNQNIDPVSTTGQQIFQHELVHVQEKHTLDKLFMQVIIAAFWCNPFFWLIKKELSFIHEFIADKKAIVNHDTATLAAMILQAAYPKHFNQITNSFFQTTIKRRIAMLTKIQHPKKAYISRIIALPLFAFIAFAFTVRTKNNIIPTVALQKEFVVVIDAGHGLENGQHTGAMAGDVYEEAINLSLAQKIKEWNTNNHIRIILSRADNNSLSLQERVAIAKKEKADLFVSIHVNADAENAPAETGFQIYIPTKNEKLAKQSSIAGSAFAAALSNVYKTNTNLLKRASGIYVLNEAVCAAVLIECGSLTNEKDKVFISDEKNQALVAKGILKGIQQYASMVEKTTSSLTLQQKEKEIASVDIHKNKNEMTIVYRDGSSEAMSVQEAQKKGLINNDFSQRKRKSNKNSVSGVTVKVDGITLKPLYVVDGVEMPNMKVSTLDAKVIKSINVVKGNAATDKYGDKGKNGVVEITMQRSAKDEIILQENGQDAGSFKGNLNIKDNAFSADFASYQDQEIVMEKPEILATTNLEQWRAFLRKKLTPIINDLSKTHAKGTYVVNLKFIVHKDGSLSNIQVIDKNAFDFAPRIVAMMADSPKWLPAEHQGKRVASYHVQPIRLKLE